MLTPKNTKFRKERKGRIHGAAKGNAAVTFGEFGLKALQAERITSRQIEAARRAITRFMRRQGKLWIKIFPHTPVTKKPLEVRQGKGKGSVEFYAAKVKPGVVMFELGGVSEEVARGAFERASAKLPIKTKFIKRVD